MSGVRELPWFSPCELLLLEAGSRGRGYIGKLDEVECPSLKAAAKQWLVKTVTGWEDLLCPIGICEIQ